MSKAFKFGKIAAFKFDYTAASSFKIKFDNSTTLFERASPEILSSQFQITDDWYWKINFYLCRSFFRIDRQQPRFLTIRRNDNLKFSSFSIWNGKGIFQFRSEQTIGNSGNGSGKFTKTRPFDRIVNWCKAQKFFWRKSRILFRNFPPLQTFHPVNKRQNSHGTKFIDTWHTLISAIPFECLSNEQKRAVITVKAHIVNGIAHIRNTSSWNRIVVKAQNIWNDKTVAWVGIGGKIDTCHRIRHECFHQSIEQYKFAVGKFSVIFRFIKEVNKCNIGRVEIQHIAHLTIKCKTVSAADNIFVGTVTPPFPFPVRCIAPSIFIAGIIWIESITENWEKWFAVHQYIIVFINNFSWFMISHAVMLKHFSGKFFWNNIGIFRKKFFSEFWNRLDFRNQRGKFQSIHRIGVKLQISSQQKRIPPTAAETFAVEGKNNFIFCKCTDFNPFQLLFCQLDFFFTKLNSNGIAAWKTHKTFIHGGFTWLGNSEWILHIIIPDTFAAEWWITFDLPRTLNIFQFQTVSFLQNRRNGKSIFSSVFSVNTDFRNHHCHRFTVGTDYFKRSCLFADFDTYGIRFILFKFILRCRRRSFPEPLIIFLCSRRVNLNFFNQGTFSGILPDFSILNIAQSAKIKLNDNLFIVPCPVISAHNRVEIAVIERFGFIMFNKCWNFIDTCLFNDDRGLFIQIFVSTFYLLIFPVLPFHAHLFDLVIEHIGRWTQSTKSNCGK